MGGNSQLRNPDVLDDLGALWIAAVLAVFAWLWFVDQLREGLARLYQPAVEPPEPAQPLGELPFVRLSAGDLVALGHEPNIDDALARRDSQRAGDCE